MLAFVPPALLLGILLSVAYAGALHLWKGRSLRDLMLYVVASAVGFAVGQLLGLLLQMPLPDIGQVHVIEASIFAWLALIGVRELTVARKGESVGSYLGNIDYLETDKCYLQPSAT